MLNLLNKIIGDNGEREVKKMQPLVRQINELEPGVRELSDDELRGQTDQFRDRLADGESLDDLLPEAYAAVREAARRAIGMRHYDVQIMGGIALHRQKISELKTGEGKTLMATLPLYLNALEGDGAHLVTVNDYLAKRDAVWMGPIYHALGMTVGVIQHESAYLFDPTYHNDDSRLRYLRPVSRPEAYLADITYGTNNEFGFDYLRDNMVREQRWCVQRGLHFAVVDEIDNILIDEARTPLIISAPAEQATDQYYRFARLMPRLVREIDFKVDEKIKSIMLTEDGIAKVEKLVGVENLYAPENFELTHYLEQALKAQFIFNRDRDYVLVRDGTVLEGHQHDPNAEIVIVDEFTGRLMIGRRFSEGLHQAIEAKEGVKIQNESQTWATITLQNYFRMYDKLAGMTGTAWTEREEFHTIYGLDVAVVPTHRPMIREDLPDLVYKSEDAKFKAVVEEIERLIEVGRPVLVGTVSIERSEHLSGLLNRRGVEHQVLNAKHHEREAAIVAQAGRPGAVTIATNMAGRGVDILLGGNAALLAEDMLRRQGIDPVEGEPTLVEPVRREAERICQADRERVKELGGLAIIGTERHESRRIDNQLRGRAGRQGDPGSSRFYVSLEDELMRRFGGTNIAGLMGKFGLEDDVPIEHGLVSKAIENAQTKVEGYNYDIRKHVVEYDDVLNKQREIIYGERHKILEKADLKDNVLDMVFQEIDEIVDSYTGAPELEDWDLEAIAMSLRAILPPSPAYAPPALQGLTREEIRTLVEDFADAAYQQREEEMSSDAMRLLERLLMLQVIDRLWVEHLTAIDDLRQGIGLRAYGQRDPLAEYKTEAYNMFQGLLAAIRHEVSHAIYHVSLMPAEPAPPPPPQTNREESDGAREPARNAAKKIGRNDPCPCGSGKKYKRCHGR
ncbi:MAG TPA: preprotein translocase subunit SecA, partial [Chloroflexota bacterium]|nr:preprotein translocase subunit SecA [Chloroflexota bacterium]